MSTPEQRDTSRPREKGPDVEELVPNSDGEVDDADKLLVERDSETIPTLSIVMPTLNEEEGIAECIQRAKTAIAELGVPAEIILSDSSTDWTPEIGRRMGAIVYTPDESGYGYAYRYAFRHARGEYIVMGDADTTYDFESIPRLFSHLLESDADMVLGSRLNGEIRPGSMPALHKYVGNPLLTKFLNVFYDAGVSDAHSGFRIFTRGALETIDPETNGMEFASEMIMEASVNGLNIVEVPIVYHEREGEETLDSFRDGWRHVRFMLQNAPGYLFSIPGLLLVLGGLLVMGVTYTGVRIDGTNPGVLTFITGALLVVVGFQVFQLGVFSTVITDPIRQPEDVFTKVFTEHVTLERGAAVGCLLFGLGGLYAGFLVYFRLTGGVLPAAYTMDALIALTAIIVGIQTVFSSFFMNTAVQSSRE
ncbi:glycosyltransferase family 2 protein [Halobacteriaceae archaeon SHR40]|uniref:glycosyltransferase family 2 protein n=1 Tax=Halovenus amylolytica TaxID=2500550 RepID=UPI000FE431B5